MTTSAEQWVEETLGHLLTGGSEELNQLDGAVTAAATTLTFEHTLGGIGAGAYLSIGLEDVYVWATPSTTTATVRREVRGTTAATHADGDVVQVRPRFPPHRIFRALNAELADLSSPSNGLFQMVPKDLTYTAGVEGYDLAGITDLLDIYELRYKVTGTAKQWPLIERRYWTISPGMAHAEFPSTNALFVTSGGTSGQPIRIRYKAPFGSLTSLGDDVGAMTGLHDEAHDIPPIGAAIRLSAGREIRRNFDESQGDSRRAAEVPAGANMAAANALRALHKDRVRREATRLSVLYPEPGA